MKRLIISDYRKFFRDKLFLVVCILAVVFAATTPLLYAALIGAVGSIDPTAEELLSESMSAKGQFFGAFSFGNNLGLIAPLLIGVILSKDFSFGTIRNKIISGHTRNSIFLSLFIVCATTLFGIILVHALLTLGISLFFFDYQSTPFQMADFWYLMESLLFQLLVYLFTAALVSWLCVTRRNVGMIIVLYIAIVLGSTMVAGILQVVIIALQFEPDAEKALRILNFFQRINIFNSSATIGLGSSYNSKEVWYYVLTPLLGTGGLLTLGMRRFAKKDIK